MTGIFDYLEWRGDLSFEAVPFCSADALLFSRLSYIPFDSYVPESFCDDPVFLGKIAGKIIDDSKKSGSERFFRKKEDKALLEMASSCVRYENVMLTGFVNKYDEDTEEQFSAVSAILTDGSSIIVFRGTDGTLVGWKEDFNMGFADVVPAQEDSVAYLERAAAALPGTITVVGHSKGGNLAVYAYAFCRRDIRRRIFGVVSLDGPGFNEKTVSSPEFLEIKDKTKTFIPQSSVVGLLLGHNEKFSVVHSTSSGILQHDLYSWEIKRGEFIPEENLTNSSRLIDASLKDWVSSLSPENREKLVDGIYAILSSSDGRTLRELWNGKNTVALLKAAGKTDDETRKLISEAISMLRGAVKKNLPDIIERMTKG